ncbi:MAG: MazG family protein [Sphaerobacteraceae bacterium]|nr:MAG: MazG family protein [Sphaerobacteraceae bacterium]
MSAVPLRVTVISAEHISDLPDIPFVARSPVPGEPAGQQCVLEPLSTDSDFWTTDWVANLISILESRSIDNHVGYVVPGHPMLGDRTIQALVDLDARGEINLELFDEPLPVVLTELLSASAGPPAFIDGLTLIERARTAPFDGGQSPFNTSQTSIITSIPPARAGEFLADYATRWYRRTTEVRLIPMTGELEQVVLPLDQVREESSLYPHYLIIPPVEADEYQRSSDDLQRIVARLRAPGGCPWDIEQTNQSLSKNLIEESYELLDAIERGNRKAIQEEMGDFLLQAFMHTQITRETWNMTLEDVNQSLIDKLIRRHPHVFANQNADSPDAVVQSWDEIKRNERAAKGNVETSSPLGDIPLSLPALSRLQSVLKRSRRANLDSSRLDQAVVSTTNGVDDQREQELLEQLISVARDAQEAGIDLENVVRSWTHRYEQQITSALSTSETAD